MDANALPQLAALLRRSADADCVDSKATVSAAEALRGFADNAANRAAVR